MTSSLDVIVPKLVKIVRYYLFLTFWTILVQIGTKGSQQGHKNDQFWKTSKFFFVFWKKLQNKVNILRKIFPPTDSLECLENFDTWLFEFGVWSYGKVVKSMKIKVPIITKIKIFEKSEF